MKKAAWIVIDVNLVKHVKKASYRRKFCKTCEEDQQSNLAVNILPKIQGDELSTSQHGDSEIIKACISRVWVCFSVVTVASQRTLSGSTKRRIVVRFNKQN